jgi:prophage maintenance system killer protein
MIALVSDRLIDIRFQKYKSLQDEIFNYCRRYNFLEVMGEMMYEAYLNQNKNLMVFMASHLLQLNGISLKQHCKNDIARLKYHIEDLVDEVAQHKQAKEHLESKIAELKEKVSTAKK